MIDDAANPLYITTEPRDCPSQVVMESFTPWVSDLWATALGAENDVIVQA
jgi:hypothetical protein